MTSDMRIKSRKRNALRAVIVLATSAVVVALVFATVFATVSQFRSPRPSSIDEAVGRMEHAESLHAKVRLARDAVESLGTNAIWQRYGNVSTLTGDARLLVLAALERKDLRFQPLVQTIAKGDDGVAQYARIKLEQLHSE